MSILKNILKPKTPRTGIVFIVEDNPSYSKMLDFYLKSHFPSIKKITTFPVGETCLLELDQHPDLIIIDYFLDSKYHDAQTGLETIKEIRKRNPNQNIIVLSAQDDVQVVIDCVKTHHCSYVKKDDDAFKRIGNIMEELDH